MSENVLEVKNLCKYFDVNRGMKGAQKVIAVDGISFEVKKGETFGLVGESGCGKSTLGRTILRIYEPTKGEIVFEGEDISRLSRKKMLPYRQKLQMIFQDPYASLNPRFTVGEIIEEPMVIHHMYDEKKRKERVQELLETVGLKPDHIRRYPHEFSGGQRQRIGIARTLALEPDFIVCDEPISALDVSIQAQVINLLEDIQKKEVISYLFIAHDLGMVKHISHRIGVMYLGHMVEIGESNDVYRRPLHPYSKALLSAEPIPDPKTARSRKRILLEGEIPSPIHPPKGCPFHTRCPYAMEECSQARPATYDIEGRKVACFLYSPRYLRQREGLESNRCWPEQNRTIPVRQVWEQRFRGPELCFKQASAAKGGEHYEKIMESNSDTGSGCSSGRIPCRMRKQRRKQQLFRRRQKRQYFRYDCDNDVYRGRKPGQCRRERFMVVVLR